MARGYCKCGPFRVNMMPQGMLKPYILLLMSHKQMHGLELIEEIEKRSQGMWRPGPSAIYPALAWLNKNNYIEAAWDGKLGEKAQRQYRITATGRDAIKDYRRFEKEWFEGMFRLKSMFH